MQKIKFAVKRKLIQIAAFGFCNSQVQNFLTGKIYTGKWKSFCAPGLNCYSCPAANFSCPIGALQAVNGSMEFKFSFYVVGLLLAFGVLLGRAICGFLCPFGLVQELIHKIPSPKIRLPKFFRFIKYAVLIVFVFLLPIVVTDYMGMGEPAFCKYICPAGTLEGAIPLLLKNPALRKAIGTLFSVKALILVATIVLCVFIYRFFCKAICPLGAIYGLLNKISLLHLHIEESNCTKCGVCASSCLMDVDPVKDVRSIECIHCGKCVSICPQKAIKISFGKISFGKICLTNSKISDIIE